MKKCNNCNNSKELKDFNKDKSNKDGLEYSCRDCRNKNRKNNYNNNLLVNKEKNKIKARKFRKTRKDYLKDYDLKRFYGIDLNEYNIMLKNQNFSCKICKTTNPKGRHNTFHVDHDHITKKVRGLLCNKCNVGLGSFKDDIIILTEAILYLVNQNE
jgi:hypothetical protein